MDRRYKALIAVGVACLTAGILAGCGNKDEAETTPTDTMSSPGAMSSPAAGAPAPPGPAGAPR